MRLFTKKGTVGAFYYLMAADGEIGSSELEKLRQIAAEIELKGYEACLEEIQAEYEKRRARALPDDEQYDLLIEGVDASLADIPAEEKNSITPRLLLWDMLVMANADGQYHPQERRLIRHVARTMNIDNSIFLEMEQLVQTGAAVAKEISWLSTSTKPYNEVQPIIVELENRQAVILNEAKALLKDEQEPSVEALKYEPDFVDDALNTIVKAVAPVAEGVEKAVTPVFEKVGNQAEKVFGGLKGLLKKKDTPTDSEPSQNGDTVEGDDD